MSIGNLSISPNSATALMNTSPKSFLPAIYSIVKFGHSLVIVIKAVAEIGVIPYTHLSLVKFLLAVKLMTNRNKKQNNYNLILS